MSCRTLLSGAMRRIARSYSMLRPVSCTLHVTDPAPAVRRSFWAVRLSGDSAPETLAHLAGSIDVHGRPAGRPCAVRF